MTPIDSWDVRVTHTVLPLRRTRFTDAIVELGRCNNFIDSIAANYFVEDRIKCNKLRNILRKIKNLFVARLIFSGFQPSWINYFYLLFYNSSLFTVTGFQNFSAIKIKIE